MLMKTKQTDYKTDNFKNDAESKLKKEDFDPLRLKRVEQRWQKSLVLDEEVDDADEQKTVLKIHKFREDARKNEREATQQTYDMMKMASHLSKSCESQDKFNFIGKNKKIKSFDNSNMRVADNEIKQQPDLNLKLDTEFSTSVSATKFKIKRIFEHFPYKKISLQLEPNKYLNPKFQFFLFNESSASAIDLNNMLVQIGGEDSFFKDLRDELRRRTHYLDYFDFLHYARWQSGKNETTQNYPMQLTEIAKNTSEIGVSSDEEDFNKDEIKIEKMDFYHRIFQCESSELFKIYDSMYFPNLQDFERYKSFRQIQYMNLKIEDEDIFIGTDVRFIISSEKIYIINIIEEIKLLIELSQNNREKALTKKIYQNMLSKIDEYIHLICGYTKSTILIRYNIEDFEKIIEEFLFKSIKYNKPYQTVSKEVLTKYPALEIWYNLPEKIFGYSREQIHNALYEIIKVTIEFSKKIKQQEQYQELQKRRYNRRYSPEEKKK